MSRNAARRAVSNLLLSVLTLAGPSTAQGASPTCTVDLRRVGQMEDILSNALTLDLGKDGSHVRRFLTEARADAVDGADLLKKTAAEFQLSEADLTVSVERFRHVNCGHGEDFARGDQVPDRLPLSTFAEDVTLHVVLHELGHALIREFDLPVLGNEETMADAFATHYLTAHLPERAPAVLQARVASLMFEAKEVPREEWSVRGEHGSDARRAHQIAALAIAADPHRYRAVAEVVEMSDADLRSSADYGTEIHRSWRRVLQPLWMPEDLHSGEARLQFDSDTGLVGELRASGLASVLEGILPRFDWHSQVTLLFAAGEGGAGWSRSKRTITVHDEYVERFVIQGRAIAASK